MTALRLRVSRRLRGHDARPWPRRVPAAVALAAIAVALVGHRAGGTPLKPVAPYAALRAQAIQAQFDQIDEDYILLLGDSHVERTFLPQLCGLPVVNAGISGATAADLLDLAERAQPPRRARGLVLIVGTNDIWSKRAPDEAGVQARFAMTVRRLIARLAAWSDRIAVSAIPAVAAREAAQFPPQTASRYSTLLDEACPPAACTFRLLLAADAPIGREQAKSGFAGDGVHLVRYGDALRGQEAQLCESFGIARRLVP